MIRSRRRNEDYWLVLEPYVHVITRNMHTLFYNSLSKTALEYHNEPQITRIAEQLSESSNGYVIRLLRKELLDTTVAGFIDKLRETFMGDLIGLDRSAAKPVNFPPKVMLLNPVHPKIPEAGKLEQALDINNYLREIIIYLNTGSPAATAPYTEAFKQFIFPQIPSEPPTSLAPETLFHLLDESVNYNLAMLHITGVDLSSYPDLEPLIARLGKIPFKKKFHLPADTSYDLIRRLSSLPKVAFAFYFTNSFSKRNPAGNLKTLFQNYPKADVEYNFLITDLTGFQEAAEIISGSDLQHAYFKPVFTGSNRDFFRDNVFLSKEDILASEPDQLQVFSRQTINEHDFGKLTVLPTGEVYANVNDPMLGKLPGHSLYTLVEHELTAGTSWKRNRSEVAPCKDCIYQFLCPPVSSYEIFMTRYNFCHIIPEPCSP
jgi:pseudo-rSAM protein